MEWILRHLGDGDIPVADLNAKASHCEVYIDEFSLSSHDYRGAWSQGIVMTLQTRSQDAVRRAGLVAVVDEVSESEGADGSVVTINLERTLGTYEGLIPLQPARYSIGLNTAEHLQPIIWHERDSAFCRLCRR